MKKKYLYLFFLLVSEIILAQNVEEIFDKANKLYRSGHYEEALTAYLKIEKKGVHSDDLYYNIGNVHYKLNHIAPSIFYYEKALLINPQHQDAKNNLVFAQRMTIDAFESLPKSVFQKINNQIIYPIHYNYWAWIGVILGFMSSFFFLLYYFIGYTGRKRFFFTLSIISFFLFLISISFTIKAKHHDLSNQPAIVFSPKASVKTEPIITAIEIFDLHEGTKVQILEQVDNWYKIKLIDGKIGWIPYDDIKKIK